MLVSCYGQEHKPRVWKHKNGTNAVGTFVEFDKGTVHIRYGEQIVEIPLSDLSSEDAYYIGNLLGLTEANPDQDGKSNDKGVKPLENRETLFKMLEKPPAMVKFTELVKDHAMGYRNAANELQKSSLRTERANSLRKALPNHVFQGWKGIVSRMTTDTNRDAIIQIDIDGPNNRLLNTHHPIKHESDLYRLLKSSSVGDFVEFDGEFILSESDHFLESSITEQGSMIAPEFEIRITRIFKIPISQERRP